MTLIPIRRPPPRIKIKILEVLHYKNDRIEQTRRHFVRAWARPHHWVRFRRVVHGPAANDGDDKAMYAKCAVA